MRALIAVVMLVAAFAHAESVYMCAVTSSGTSVNSSTVAACHFAAGSRYEVQCTGRAYVQAVNAAGSATTTNDRLLPRETRVPFLPEGSQGYAAVLSVGATSTCRFFRAWTTPPLVVPAEGVRTYCQTTEVMVGNSVAGLDGGCNAPGDGGNVVCTEWTDGGWTALPATPLTGRSVTYAQNNGPNKLVCREGAGNAVVEIAPDATTTFEGSDNAATELVCQAATAAQASGNATAVRECR